MAQILILIVWNPYNSMVYDCNDTKNSEIPSNLWHDINEPITQSNYRSIPMLWTKSNNQINEPINQSNYWPISTLPTRPNNQINEPINQSSYRPITTLRTWPSNQINESINQSNYANQTKKSNHQIQTHKWVKRTLFIRTKHNTTNVVFCPNKQLFFLTFYVFVQKNAIY